MMPGPDLLYQCPDCSNYLYNKSLMSGNTMGARLFSDGKMYAPMLPEYPTFTKCKKCNNFLWLNRMTELGQIGLGGSKEMNEFVRRLPQFPDKAEFPSIAEYFEALDRKVYDNRQDEIFIRMRIWWAFNDRGRGGGDLFREEDDEIKYLDNIASLINLIDGENLDQKVSLAELYRNIGDFSMCTEIIEGIEDAEMSWLKIAFLTECERKNKLVFRLR